MYVENGAYFNLQHDQSQGYNWSLSVYFNQDGSGTYTPEGMAFSADFEYPTNSWFEVKLEIDIDSDAARISIDETLFPEWIWSSGSIGSNSVLSALNLYPLAEQSFYIDNILFSSINCGESLETPIVGCLDDSALNYYHNQANIHSPDSCDYYLYA
jgi:hypothetical protein